MLNTFRVAKAGGTYGAGTDEDPYDSYVAFAFNMNDSSFQDLKGHAVTNHGVVLDTDLKVNGQGSGSFAAGTYLSTVPLASMLGNQNFCIEGWIRLGAADNADFNYVLFDDMDAGGVSGFTLRAFRNHYNTVRYMTSFQTYSGGVYLELAENNFTMPDRRTWVHMAMVRNGNWLNVFRQGTMILSGSIPAGAAVKPNAAASGFAIGRCSSYYTPSFYGQQDMVRVTIGHPRYTTAFTPSTTYL